jgi:hypothetical protein
MKSDYADLKETGLIVMSILIDPIDKDRIYGNIFLENDGIDVL